MKLNKYLALIGLTSLSLISCAVQQQQTPKKVQIIRKSERSAPASTPTVSTPPKKYLLEKNTTDLQLNLPEVKREFRAAWIATVANINWPSSRNLSTEEQKNEAIRILDLLEETNFNAVVFQVRPSADALYKSDLEPWSYYLTGETGRAPYPYYDPLAFWIEEAHKRGMELHVWLNPYRAHHLSGGGVSSASMVKKSPSNMVKLKNGMYWFDPASNKTQDHVAGVVKDIVSRYDIDAVHFDDYFYPYASYNGGADFPDTASWNVYKNNDGSLSKADWRRDHVNKFIERINKEIKEEKSYVKFGISPFGIWKSGYPTGVVGSSQYDELYADAKLWLNKGWVDYFSPQLYWPINSQRQSFRDLLEWWEDENTMNRHLWPGLNTVEVKAPNRATEIVNQVKMTNEVLSKQSVGAVHYSVAGLMNNREMVSALKNGPYKEKALIPKSPWMKIDAIDKPTLRLSKDFNTVSAQWEAKAPKKVFQWVLFTQYDQEWSTEILNKDVASRTIQTNKEGKKLKAVALKAIDRLGNESTAVFEKIN